MMMMMVMVMITKVITTLTDKEIAIYALGKTEGIHCIAETFGKGFDDKKYVESWSRTLSLLGVKMPLKDLEEIYDEFAKKMDEVAETNHDSVEGDPAGSDDVAGSDGVGGDAIRSARSDDGNHNTIK